ncbi:MAG: APC family permease [Bryobacterales bacterium]
MQTALTAAFLAAALTLVGYGLLFGNLANIHSWFASPERGALGGFLAVFVTAPFWFVGFDTIPQSAEEASGELPPRRLGLLILGSIAAAAVFYCLLILSVAMAGDWREVASAPLATAEAFRRALGSDAASDLVLVAALLGLLTSWNGFFLAAARVLFAMGRGAVLPESFGSMHRKHGAPSAAVLWCGAVTALGCLLGRGAMLAFVNVGSFCIALAFLGVCQSAASLRVRHPRAVRPYEPPGGRLTAFAALGGATFILAAIALPFSPAALRWPLEWGILAALCASGAAAWAFGARVRSEVSDEARARLILGDSVHNLDSRATVRLDTGAKS